ncbi:PREDICTED: pantetheinase isoform X3 [Propithecus coquereli]|uniref:pantetheinase isoform X3 n=1 Tax=Propithecus coquereli TaxID=379532 RepID=UPI00063ED4A1|nr:PREDICTED: pantetheinase isoform X3 [Propithecus coquereli]
MVKCFPLRKTEQHSEVCPHGASSGNSPTSIQAILKIRYWQHRTQPQGTLDRDTHTGQRYLKRHREKTAICKSKREAWNVAFPRRHRRKRPCWGLLTSRIQSLDFSMITSPSLAYVAILVFCVSKTSSLDTFIAAVYEHAVLLPNTSLTPVSREEALALMNRNLDLLEGAIASAAEQGAHIIVTPEDGIYGWNFNRESLYPYLEDIPHPQVNWIPCNDPNRFGHTPVQERLSCLAKENSIYVVANIGDKKPCNASDPQCPPDGRYQYNTDVVFDSQGRLVARYHKQNLFLGEDQFNAPKEPEVVTFNTTFGRFGIFTCFDILFHHPAVTLVKDFHVDTILFPTAWMNVLPHLSAIEFHSAWAMGMGVNFLASNIHYPSMRMTGSGIYAPNSARVFHYDMKTKEGKLLLSQLDSHPHHPVVVNWPSYASSVEALSTGNQEFKGIIFFDEYTFVELKGVGGNYTVCQKDLCCHLSYKMSEKRSDEVYALGAFDGLHTVEGRYYLQICTLVKCKTTDLNTCGDSVETASTRFEMFSLSGTFGTQYVFPEVLLSEIQLAPGEFQVSSDGRLYSLKPTSGPILTVTLFGRLYEKDGASNASSDLIAQALRIMLAVIIPIVYSLSW